MTTRAILLLGALAVAGPVREAPFLERGGLDFVLHNAASGEKHLIETMVGGVAVLDYDQDGYPDIFFTNGAEQPSLQKTQLAFRNRLFRNRRDGTFEDVTEKAGLAGSGYDVGVAAADFDNDGYPDLFVAGVGRSTLYRNRGDGTFEDVTVTAGIQPGVWSVGAGWFDYDNDGLLDLFVVNYVRWNAAADVFCGDAKGAYRTYCHPQLYSGLSNTLYHNNGDGTFTDVSRESGIAAHVGKGMAVAFADYDGDGLLDIMVANDTVPNFLFHNEGGGKFREVGAVAGVGMNDDGRALSSMGVDFRDIDNDGRPDSFLSALANETFPLYHNEGHGLFRDVTYASRIGTATMAYSGWGCGIFDFDNDGYKDIFVANGDVQTNTEVYSGRQSRQPNLLLLNNGRGAFDAVPVGAAALHRGAAFGDFDRDGRVDVVISRIGERPLLLHNNAGAGRHWIGLRLIGTRSNRDGIGAQVRIETSAGPQWNQTTTATGYASSSEPVVHFGLGSAERIRVIEIRWPSGVKQRLENIAPDRYLTVRES
ncbi:MAG TPA: CRTAC1 family protein [Solibacterales bacterium]|nr:CRTAC1 family protein [Bryobacterales bacterium]